MRWFLLVTVAALGVLALPACHRGASTCDTAVAEPIDPLSSQHLLPGAPEPVYNTNPPTSGAHRPSPLPDAVLTTPLDKPVQVAALEGGQVLIQYGAISSSQRASLRSLARQYDHVTVAPGRDLPSKVVATAWLYMQRCDGVDTHALQDFVILHGAKHKND
ncbi:MAG TPA: DUF3105 domain-containing protein [Acidimicrobiales bacterium]|nr:DUF3105 domain-containing protein [Acidimicrobiales bacterium]